MDTTECKGQGAAAGADVYRLTRDGAEVMRGTEAEVWHYIHSHHSYSLAHAVAFEGYRVEPPIGGKDSAHTPGPWHYDGHGVNSAEGERIAKVQYQRWADDAAPARFEADSILMAASPELLIAAQTALLHLEGIAGAVSRGESVPLPSAADLAFIGAAIAKATGDKIWKQGA